MRDELYCMQVSHITHCLPFIVSVGLLQQKFNQALDLLIRESAGTKDIADTGDRQSILRAYTHKREGGREGEKRGREKKGGKGGFH